MAKTLPYNFVWMSFYKIVKFVLTKKILKVWSDPKVNPQIDKDINP